MVKYFSGLSYSTSDLDVESDCEGDFSELDDQLPKVRGRESLVAVLMMGSFQAYVHPLQVLSLPQPRWQTLQLEISTFLPLHRRYFVCSPHIARGRPSLELHSHKHGRGGAPSLLPEEHIRSGEPGETVFNQKFKACY